MAELTRGNLRLAITPTFTPYLVAPLIVAFNAEYPNITLSLREMPQAEGPKIRFRSLGEQGVC